MNTQISLSNGNNIVVPGNPDGVKEHIESAKGLFVKFKPTEFKGRKMPEQHVMITNIVKLQIHG